MPQPASLVDWASDANIATGTEAGTPTKVDPGSAYLKQGGVPGNQFVAPYWNYTLNNFYSWLNYLKTLDTDSYFLGRTYSWTAAHTHAALSTFNAGATGTLLHGTTAVRAAALQLYTGDLLYTDSSGAAATRARSKAVPLAFVIGGTSPAAEWEVGGTGVATALGGQAIGSVFIVNVPTGAVITNVSAGFTDAGVAGTMKVWKESVNLGTGALTQTQVGTTGTSGTGVAYGVLSTGAVTHTVDNAASYRIEFDSGAAGAIVHGIVVQFNDIGFTGNG